MKLVLFIFRFFLSLRYRVKITGSENLKHNGPILILPNHVALVDPEILITFLGKYISVSPLASEKYYNKPGLKQAMDLVGTIPIGEMSEGANSLQVKSAFKEIKRGLEMGKNILIYPSGQIYRQGYESIIGKQSVYQVVNMMSENTKIVGIKTRGLWGSMFSMAWDNGKTPFFSLLLKGIRILFANLLFFAPRREVNIEIYDITKDIIELKNDDLNVMNKYLELFYNTHRGENYVEQARFIKHYFYHDDVAGKVEPDIISGSIKELNFSVKRDISSVDFDVVSKIYDKLSLMKGISNDKIKGESNLVLDLFLDSLDLAEIKSYIQANFEKSSNPPILDLKTVGDLIFMAIGQSNSEEKLKPCDWGKDFSDVLMVKKIR